MPMIRARLKTVNYCGNLGFSIGFGYRNNTSASVALAVITVIKMICACYVYFNGYAFGLHLSWDTVCIFVSSCSPISSLSIYDNNDVCL